jgi:3',5'-cyclic AMP phosphodiesterase CpdA
MTLAHLSDLHLGRSDETDRAAAHARDAVKAGAFDHAVITGDVTNRGRRQELERFEALFGPLIRRGRVSLVPGNHDRLGDDMGARLMRGGRVEIDRRDGLYLVRVDSTGPHNKFLLAGHGELDDEAMALLDDALDRAPADELVVVVLHHHPLPLPEETFPEFLSTRLGWPWAAELRRGPELLARVRGRCDLVLHGHRHVPRATALWTEDARPIGLYNAGCTTALGRFRVFQHAAGRLAGPPIWIDAGPLPTVEAQSERLAGTGTEGT